MKKTIFKGAGVAIITPFTEDGVNYDELGRIIEDQIANGTDAIVITGTTGESSTMSDEEHKEAIRYTVEKVNKRIPVIAGTGSNETSYAIQLSKYAEEVGADGLLLVTPYYNKATQKGLIAHYTAIADAVNIPIILYNVPSRTGVTIQIPTFVELAKHPNIVAVKEASGNLSAVAKIRHAVGDALDIYSGNDDQIVPILSLGGKGVISVLSNICPQETHDMVQAYLDGDANKCTEMMAKYLELANAMFVEVNPIPVKAACNMMGWAAGPCKMPLCEMTDEHTEYVKSVMQKFGLIK